jgi:Dolichyl-phosphate-mannose-protein mannosyltransferase
MSPTQVLLADAPTTRRRTVGPSAWELAAAVLIAAFLLAEVVRIAVAANGPTLDEAIYVTAGHRTLEGYGLADGYLGWFAGSLLWPVLAALGDSVAGLDGARALAAVFVTIAVAAMWRAAVILFGPRAGFFSVALAVAAAPVLALGHLAVIDAPAAAGIAVAFWAVAELARRDHRGWLVVAAAAYSLAVLAKYPTAASVVPLVLLIVLLRGRSATMDLAVAVLLATAVFIIYFLSARGPLADFVSWRVENNPNFGVSRPSVAFSQLWYGGLPLLLALGGWIASRRKALATVLVLGGLLFPVYHVASANSVGDTKHIVFGLIFVLPLAGRLMDGIARQSGATLACLAVVGAGLFGAFQAQRLDSSWIDVRPAADYLAAHARPDQRFLVDNSWPFTRRLYEADKIDSPWQVFDPYRLSHGELPGSVCRADWFVVAQGAGRWPARVRRRIAACGSFRLVYRERAPVTSIGSDLGFVTWKARVAIYRNVGKERTG